MPDHHLLPLNKSVGEDSIRNPTGGNVFSSTRPGKVETPFQYDNVTN